MITKKKWAIKSGEQYDHLFPRPLGQEILIKKNPSLKDTLHQIEKVAYSTLDDTREIAKVLKGNDVFETCRNAWYFVKDHIPYRKDGANEVISRPAVTWANRKRYKDGSLGGEDCDGYTNMLCSILLNCGIRNTLCTTGYWYDPEDKYSHIYVTVPQKDGTYITLDCVTDKFNYEEPFVRKYEIYMDLYYLNGLEYPGSSDSEEVGKLKILSNAGKVVKKTLNAVNKVNPATTALREGIKLSLKMDVFNVADKLKYAYLSDDEARKRGFNMERFAKLKKVMEKMSSIFYTAGGDPENLKKSILTGKGNQNNEVPLSGLQLSTEDYAAEFDMGIGQLGSATLLAAASSVMAGIAALVKGIGEFKTAKEEKKAKEEAVKNSSASTGSPNEPAAGDQFTLPAGDDSNYLPEYSNQRTTDPSANKSAAPPPPPDPGFWENNKKWIVPTGIGVGVLTAGYLVYKNQTDKKPTPAGIGRLIPHEGEPFFPGEGGNKKRRRNKKNKGKSKNKKKRIKAVKWR